MASLVWSAALFPMPRAVVRVPGGITHATIPALRGSSMILRWGRKKSFLNENVSYSSEVLWIIDEVLSSFSLAGNYLWYVWALRCSRQFQVPGALTVSKWENFVPFFHWNLVLWHSKHILSHCEGSQKCIFHVLYASVIPLSNHFVTEQQQAVGGKMIFIVSEHI